MIDLLRKRLKHYSATNAAQEEQAVKRGNQPAHPARPAAVL